MRQQEKQAPQSAEKTVRDIRRATRRQFSAEDKIRIVLEGLRGEDSIAELCRKEGIAQNLYYRWSKEFLEAGKKRLAGDTAREATSDEVKTLRAEAPPALLGRRILLRSSDQRPATHLFREGAGCAVASRHRLHRRTITPPAPITGSAMKEAMVSGPSAQRHVGGAGRGQA